MQKPHEGRTASVSWGDIDRKVYGHSVVRKEVFSDGTCKHSYRLPAMFRKQNDPARRLKYVTRKSFALFPYENTTRKARTLGVHLLPEGY